MDQDRTRVAVVGDSFVVNDFGLGKPRHAVPKNKNILHFFSTDEDVLKAGPPPMVQGFGASGLRVRGDPRWHDVTLELADFKPDLVIVFCGGNDFCGIDGASLGGVSGEDLFRSCQGKMSELQLSLPGLPQIRWALLHPRLPRYWSSDLIERWNAEAKAFNSAALEYHRDGKHRSHSGHPHQFVPRRQMCYAVGGSTDFLAADGVHPDSSKASYRRILYVPTKSVFLTFQHTLLHQEAKVTKRRRCQDAKNAKRRR